MEDSVQNRAKWHWRKLSGSTEIYAQWTDTSLISLNGNGMRLVLRRFRSNKQTYVGFLRPKNFSGKIKIRLKNIHV